MTEAVFFKTETELRVETRSTADKSLLLWEEVRTIGKHPARRSYHSAVMWGDQMLVYGGQDLSEGPQNDLWSIEIGQFDNNSWQRLSVEDKGSLTRHSAILHNNKMLIFGGTDSIEEFNRTLVLDLSEMKWEEIKAQDDLPPPLDSHTANLLEASSSQMIVFGGYSRGVPTNQVYSLDLQSYKWSHVKPEGSSAPEPRSSHSACIHSHTLYIFGGISEESEKLNDFWRLVLNSSANTWEKISASGQVPSGRSGHSSVLYKDYMVIFGGIKDITKETNDMYSYDFSRDTWGLFQCEQQIKDPVSSAEIEEFKKAKALIIAAREKKLLTESSPTSSLRSQSPRKTRVGGMSVSPTRHTANETIEPGKSFRRRKTLYEGPLNPTEGRIRGKCPHPRDGHSAVVHGDIMIIFGGDRHQMSFNDTYVYYLSEEFIESNRKLPIC